MHTATSPCPAVSLGSARSAGHRDGRPDLRDDEAAWFEDGPAPGALRRGANALAGAVLGLLWVGPLALVATAAACLPRSRR